jgi:hypothetical protein
VGPWMVCANACSDGVSGRPQAARKRRAMRRRRMRVFGGVRGGMARGN